MCGRFTNRLSWSELVRIYRIAEPGPALDHAPRFNVAPTQPVAAVRLRPQTGARELVLLRWGLVPAWAKAIAVGARMINARAETIGEKPSFREALRWRRCLVPADGFYEWQKQATGPKQPYLIGLKGGAPFAFAGLWERWETSPDGRPVESCAIVTTDANGLLRPIHERMPVILSTADHDAWLDVDGTPAEAARALLRPFPADAMAASAVSLRVNSVANDDAACVAPLPLPNALPAPGSP